MKKTVIIFSIMITSSLFSAVDTLWSKMYTFSDSCYASSSRDYDIIQINESNYILKADFRCQTGSDWSYMIGLLMIDSVGNILSTENVDIENQSSTNMEITTDQGYVIGLSSTDSVGIVKLDSNRQEEWRSYQQGGTLYSIGVCSDGGYTLGGSWDGGGFSKIDSIGNLLWTSICCGDVRIHIELSDGGYILFNHPSRIVKTDNMGIELWSTELPFANGYSSVTCRNAIKSDNGYIVTGDADSFYYGYGLGDIFLMEIDLNGNILWINFFGTDGDDYGYSVESSIDGGYIVSGALLNNNRFNPYILKTNDIGEKEWDLLIPYNSWSFVYNTKQITPNEILAIGKLEENPDKVKLWKVYLTPKVVINEIMNNPSAVDDSDGEWIELYNTEPIAIDINGWVLKDNDNDSLTIIENNSLIQPNSYFVLGVNDNINTNGGINVDLLYNRDDFNLGNSNDEIIIVDQYGLEVDRVEYDDGTTFPDPNGKSMELNYFGFDNNDGNNWFESTHLLPSGDYGTPGASNSMLYPELYIDLIEGYYLGTPPETDTVYSYQLGVQNNGTGELLLSSIETQLTGQENPDSYIYTEYDQDSIIVIPPFQQGYIEIYFYPPYSSIFHDTLMFTTNDSNYSYVEIPLEAWVTAEEHEIHIEPSLNELIFDTLEVGQSQEKVLQIYNLGYTTLEIDEISTTPPFSVDPEDGSIDVLDFMDILVSFSPDSIGDYTGQLVIESNDSDEGTLVLTLIGYSYVLGVDDESNQLPFSYVLHQNYPNPFNPVTTLRYDLPEQSKVNIIIYDIMGRELKTLVNTTQDAGFKSVIWDATNNQGNPVSAGVYLYQIQAGEFVQTKKMVLLK